LTEVIADRHLAAEAVAAVLDRHPGAFVAEGVDQDRHLQSRPAQRVRNRALVAEVRERHDHAVDLVTVLAKEVGACACVRETLDGAVQRRLRVECDDAEPVFPQRRQNLGATRRAQVRREKAAVPDDEPQRRWSFRHDAPSRYHAARLSESAP
jgi:hypothetical protein